MLNSKSKYVHAGLSMEFVKLMNIKIEFVSRKYGPIRAKRNAYTTNSGVGFLCYFPLDKRYIEISGFS